MGSVPMSAAMVVIMIGRKRTQAGLGGWPRAAAAPARCASMAKSTIMMPFFFTRPTSMMMPTKA